jgi:hypothetical protein
VTESDFTRAVLQELRLHPGVTRKLADRFTKGLPDLFRQVLGKCTWMELKFVSRGDNPVDLVAKDKVQLYEMHLLSTHGRAWYVILHHNRLTFWHPEFLVRRIITDKNLTWSDDIYFDVEAFYEKMFHDCGKHPIRFPNANLRPIVLLTEV